MRRLSEAQRANLGLAREMLARGKSLREVRASTGLSTTTVRLLAESQGWHSPRKRHPDDPMPQPPAAILAADAAKDSHRDSVRRVTGKLIPPGMSLPPVPDPPEPLDTETALDYTLRLLAWVVRNAGRAAQALGFAGLMLLLDKLPAAARCLAECQPRSRGEAPDEAVRRIERLLLDQARPDLHPDDAGEPSGASRDE